MLVSFTSFYIVLVAFLQLNFTIKTDWLINYVLRRLISLLITWPCLWLYNVPSAHSYAVCLRLETQLDCVRWWLGGTTGSASDQQSTNDRKVVGSRPTKVVCITVLTGNRMGWTARCGRPPLLLPSCRKLEFRLSALMDSHLAWVNGKSGRQSWS